MALSAGTIFEVQTGGSDTANGGGFNPANTSMATDLSAGSSSGNTSAVDVSSASYTFVSRDVGHWLFIKSGTNWRPGWYKIDSVIAGHAILDATIGHAILFSPSPNNVPYSLSTAVGAASTASPTGGTWSIDYSQGTPISFTDMVIDGTTNTNFTSSGNPVGKNYVGNLISVTSGTGFTVQYVEVLSTSSTVATCDKSLGTLSSTGGNGKLGGPLASPGKVGSLKVAGNSCFIKTGTYTITSSSANVAGGKIADSTGGVFSSQQTSLWEGYDTYRCDHPTANRPVISAGAVTGITIMALTSQYHVVQYLVFDGNSAATTKGLTGTSIQNVVRYCKVQNTTSEGMTHAGRVSLLFCEATGCSGSWVFSAGLGCDFLFCEAWSNTTSAFVIDNCSCAVGCLAYGNTGASTDGFQLGPAASTIGCIAYANGRHGFYGNGNTGHSFINCIAEGNTGSGFQAALTTFAANMLNCGYYNNGTNVNTGVVNNTGGVLGSGSFFTNAASADFSLNNTSGAGAALRAVGFPSTFPRGLTANYHDIGAAQHQDAGGGGGAINTPVLAVADNGDGTGAVATITNATSGTTNTVMVGNWNHGIGTVSFTSGGSRTGNGTVSLSLAVGTYWAYVQSTATDAEEPSNFVFFRVTDTVTALPINERIGLEILDRLETVTTGNGYSQTLDVERPKRKGVQGLLGFKTVLVQAPEAEFVEILEGVPATITWRQLYEVYITIAPSDTSTTPLDTVANIAAADAEMAITDGGGGEWSSFGGLARYAEQTGRDIGNDGQHPVVRLAYTVTYRHPENDPKTPR